MQAVAAQDYLLGEDKIRANISRKTINRIEFAESGISEIIGDDDKYQFSIDARGMNLFLKSNNSVNVPIELSIISNSGQVADLVLTPRQGLDGQIIKIKNYHNKQNYHSDIKLEAKKMLQAMISGSEDKYYIYKTKKVIDTRNSELSQTNLQIKQEYIYRFGNLVGSKLLITNKSRKTSYYLSSKEIKKLFKGVILLSPELHFIKPKSTVEMFLVSYQGNSND